MKSELHPPSQIATAENRRDSLVRRAGASIALCAALAVLLPASVQAATSTALLTTLQSLAANTDGRAVSASTLVQGTDGNFYGTTEFGGANNFGSVFRITPSGELTTLLSFNTPRTIGISPQGNLVQGTDGNFYGVTNEGGDISDDGSIFKITPSGKLTTLAAFDGTTGSYPQAGLVQGKDGNFYGTTYSGGATKDYGTIFMVTPSGTLTTLVSLNGKNGESPETALVQGDDGSFYGTSEGGGSTATGCGTKNGCTSGDGTIFKLTVN